MATTNAQLSEQLDKVLKEVQAIRAENAAREEREKGIKEKVDKHEATLEGNGKEGLKTTVAVMRDQLGRLIAANIAVASVVGVQLIALLLAFLTHNLPGWNP